MTISSHTRGASEFLGIDDGSRDIPSDGNFTGPLGVSRDDAPIDYNMSMTAGGKHEFNNGIKVGGLFSPYYKRDSSYYDNGVNDSLWIDNKNPKHGLTLNTEIQTNRRTRRYRR